MYLSHPPEKDVDPYYNKLEFLSPKGALYLMMLGKTKMWHVSDKDEQISIRKFDQRVRAQKGPGCYHFFFLFSRNAERMRKLEETYVNPKFVHTETEAHQYASLQYIANSQK